MNKMYLQITPLVISKELTELEKEKGVKCKVFYNVESINKVGLKTTEVKSCKSTIDLNEKDLLNKPTIFEVIQTAIPGSYKTSLYYKIVGILK